MTELFSVQTIGEATLILIGAIVIGYVVTKVWPKRHNPQLFGTLIAIAVVGGLAYIGNMAAGIALALLIAAALVFGALAIGLG